MAYKYTKAQEKRYRETGERPKTSKLKRHKKGRRPIEKTYTYKGQKLTKEQHGKAIAADIQREYLDKGHTPSGKLLRATGLRVVKTKPVSAPDKVQRYRQLTPAESQRVHQLEEFKRIERRIAARTPVQKVKRITIPPEQKRSKKILADTQREIKKVNTIISTQVKKVVKPLSTYEKMGYDYAQKNPDKAKLLFPAGKTFLKVMPGYQIAKTKQGKAFSDGALKGLRDEPLKAVAFFALPGVVGVLGKAAKGVPIAKHIVSSEKAMKAASAAFGVAYTHNVYTRVNAPVVTGYKDGKVISETSTKMPDGTTQVTQELEQIPTTRNPTSSEKSERIGYIFSTEAGPMVFGAMKIPKVTKTRFTKLATSPKKTIQIKVKRAGKTVKTKTKEFVKAEKAQMLLVKQKVKTKTKPKAKPKAKPKVKTINLMKDPKSMSQLRAAQGVVNTAPKSKAQAFLKSPEFSRVVYSKTITKRVMTLENRIYGLKTGIKMRQEFNLNVKPQQKILKKLEMQLLAEQTKAQVAHFMKLHAKVIGFMKGEVEMSIKGIQKELIKLKTQAKQATTAKQKAVVAQKIKKIITSLTSQKILLLAYSKTAPTTIQKQKIIVIANSVEKQIGVTKVVEKSILKTVLVPVPKTTPRVKRPSTKTTRKTKPRPKPKPKVPIIPKIPVVAVPLPTRKLKAKKKPKKKKHGVDEFFVKNPIPTLKEFIGY